MLAGLDGLGELVSEHDDVAVAVGNTIKERFTGAG